MINSPAPLFKGRSFISSLNKKSSLDTILSFELSVLSNTLYEMSQSNESTLFDTVDYKYKKNIVLVFASYHNNLENNIPLLNLNKHYEEFVKRDTEILAYFHDFRYLARLNLAITKKFSGLRDLKFPVINDASKILPVNFGTTNSYYKITQPAIFIIDKTGNIRYVTFYDQRVGPDIYGILNTIDSLHYLTNSVKKQKHICPTENRTSNGKLGLLSPVNSQRYCKKYKIKKN
jgi:alkyl hydroperoxide reductase subunit AhpC